jgi:hypothetical protein
MATYVLFLSLVGVIANFFFFNEQGTDEIIVGLRVYSKKDATTVIKGQLRHGKILDWAKTNRKAFETQ